MTESAVQKISDGLSDAIEGRYQTPAQTIDAPDWIVLGPALSRLTVRLTKENERLRAALTRLASPEAFVMSRPTTREEIARMLYAEEALKDVE